MRNDEMEYMHFFLYYHGVKFEAIETKLFDKFDTTKLSNRAEIVSGNILQ